MLGLCPCPGRPSLGAGSQGSAARSVAIGRGWCGRGDPAPVTQRALLPAVVAGCGGSGRASPGGGAFHRCEGRLSSGALPPLAARPLGALSGSATHVLWAPVYGCGGPAQSLWLACPVGGCVPRGWWEAVPGGTAFHRRWGRQVSGAVPPRAARFLQRAAGVPQPVFPGSGWCRLGDRAPAPQRALLRAIVACCGGGGKASPGGGGACAVVRGVWVQALPPPRLPVLWAGCRGPLPTCCGCGCAGVGVPPLLGAAAGRGCVCVVPMRCLCAGGCLAVRCVLCCRGTWCCLPSSVSLVPPSLVLPRGVALAVACGRTPSPACVLRSAAGYLPSSLIVAALFTLFSTLCWPAPLPGVHFSLPLPLYLSRIFPLATSLFLGSFSFSLSWSCETKEGWGCGLLRGWRY